MKPLLSVSEARQRILAAFSPVETEYVPLAEASGRVLADNIISRTDLPAFANSSMDGFAVRAEDLFEANRGNPVVLNVVGDVPAGHVSALTLNPGEAARIMTGAPLPNGSNAVVPVEVTDRFHAGKGSDGSNPDRVTIFRGVKQWDYVRPRGQDVQAGDVVLTGGFRIRPQDVGFLAMLGYSEVPVYRRPRLALISTGDEIVPVGMALKPGQIHDSNAYTLAALIRRDGGEAVYLGIAPDREEDVRELLERSIASNANLIISSAGVSVGAFDFVRQVVEQRGRLEFWRVDMRPGKPLTFGEYRGVPFVGLPGNPVSAFVGYEVFVRPALLKMSGLPDRPRPTEQVRLQEPIVSDGRESYLRAIVDYQDNLWMARLTGHQGSGNMRSLVQANALLIIPSGVKSLPAGAEIQAWFLGDPGEIRFSTGS